MAKINKIFKILIIFLIPLTLTGCFNYRDINKVTFATSMIFDTDDLSQVIVYLDCIKPYRSTNESSDKGRRLIFKGVGKTTEDALEKIDNFSSAKLNYSQVKAYIFTEKAAKLGIKKYLDLINNYGEMQIKPSAFIYYGDVEELLKATSGDDEFLGMYLNDIMNKKPFNSLSLQANVNYYLSNRLMGDNTLLLPAVNLKKDVLDKKVQINGSGILKDNVLVDRLEQEDTLLYELMMGSVYEGTFEIGNPNTDTGFISLDVLSSSEDSMLRFDNNRFTLVKNIEVDLEISDIQGKAIVDSEFINYIKVNEEAYINSYITQLFNKYKEKGIDIFNVYRMKEIHYGKESIDDPLSICDFEINTKVNINETTILTALSSDNESPVCSISATNELKKESQTITLRCTDNEGVVAYYFGDKQNDLVDNDYQKVDTNKEFTKDIDITKSGTYHLYAKDEKGNVSENKSITLYTYKIENKLTDSNDIVSSETYIAKSGTIIDIEQVYKMPSNSSFSYYTATNSDVKYTTETQTLTDNTTYIVWFIKNT